MRRHNLSVPVLWRLEQIVHQADINNDLHDAPEAAHLDTATCALGRDHDDETVRTDSRER